MFQYTVHVRGVNQGPYSESELRDELAAGRIAGTDLCWRPDTPEWVPLAQALARDGAAPPVIPAGAPPPVRQAPAEKPTDWLIPAILSTVFCCWPVGIVAIVFAAKANSKQAAGEVAEAAKARRVARWSTMISCCGVLLIIPIGIMASLAVPALKKARNSALEKSMMNDARQISAAWNQNCAEQSHDYATVGEIRNRVSALSSGNSLGVEKKDGSLVRIDFSAPETENLRLTKGEHIVILNENYRRDISSRREIAAQKLERPYGIVFDLETGRVEE